MKKVWFEAFFRQIVCFCPPPPDAHEQGYHKEQKSVTYYLNVPDTGDPHCMDFVSAICCAHLIKKYRLKFIKCALSHTYI